MCVCGYVPALTPCVLVFTLTDDRLLLFLFEEVCPGCLDFLSGDILPSLDFFLVISGKKNLKLVPFDVDLSQSWVRIPNSADPVRPESSQVELEAVLSVHSLMHESLCPRAAAHGLLNY